MADTFGWVPKGSLKGPKGDAGEQGPKGDGGRSVRVARIDVTDNSDVAFSSLSPSDGTAAGASPARPPAPGSGGAAPGGDAAGDVYTVESVNTGASTAHVGAKLEGVSLKGPQGPAGADGKDGTGVTILGSYDDIGALQEAHPTGSAGDAYLVEGDLYVWSATESAWKNVGTIQGPQGPKGDTGAQGPKGDTGATGPAGPGISFGSGTPSIEGTAGQMYVDTDTMTVYGYEKTGA